MTLDLSSCEQTPRLTQVTAASWEFSDKDGEGESGSLERRRWDPFFPCWTFSTLQQRNFKHWDLMLTPVLLQFFSRTHFSSELRTSGHSCKACTPCASLLSTAASVRSPQPGARSPSVLATQFCFESHSILSLYCHGTTLVLLGPECLAISFPLVKLPWPFRSWTA